jgi:hypothetical protein
LKNFFILKNSIMKKTVLLNLLLLSLLEMSCNDPPTPTTPLVSRSPTGCAPLNSSGNAGAAGTAKVFSPDPLVRSGDPGLSPASVRLDDYLEIVPLQHLKGNGVLQGNFIEVLNGIKCLFNFGAYDAKNQFAYSHNDWMFQEAMAYYWGDSYQSYLKSIGYLHAGGLDNFRESADNYSPSLVQIIAHCELNDNAYFLRGMNSAGKILEQVCLGDSVRTPGAFYGDDSIVTIHELQHATTTDSYSPVQELNQLFYDEAGSLNEAISDAMGLFYTVPFIPSMDKFDPRIFSRWALGTFDPKRSHMRGAHKCPVYDSHYPNCEGFPGFSVPQSSNSNQTTISYVYPDGMGWPYPTNQRGSNVARKIFMSHSSQEEIHNGGILMVGALWDIYSILKSNHPGDELSAGRRTSQLILEAVRHLPMANTITNHSPVTFVGFASLLVSYAPFLEGITLEDQSAIQNALQARGLYNSPVITDSNWLSVGPGTNFKLPESRSPGLYIEDDPEVLIQWLSEMGGDPQLVTQGLGTGLNRQLDPGETVAVWFDLQNNADLTAGGVLVSVASSDPEIEILDQRTNIGYMTRSGLNQAQIMYGKINGNSIVKALNPGDFTGSIPIGNTYFTTDPFFNRNFNTAIWIRINPSAAHGKIAHLEVEVFPSNGIASKTAFPVTIQ